MASPEPRRPGARLPAAARARLGALDPVDLALRLTLLDLLLRPIGSDGVRPAVLLLAGGGLALPPLLRRPELWLALGALAFFRIASAWPLGDNHAYLLAYWCLGVGLALVAREPGALAPIARRLIGLAFAFAVLWKVISPDYLDGRFFRVVLIVDQRFEQFTRIAGGVDDADLAQRRAYLAQHVDSAHPARGAPPPERERLRRVAQTATFATLAVELAVAAAFLWPLGRRLSRWRDPLLLGFCLATYAIAPVEGFGWLLLAMGLAQADSLRSTYIAAYAVLLLYRELPWGAWILRALGG
ncbi:MAG TPA: hypothetical protein VFT98_08435 [Myxococcota bacterium]|nr:hypothetical protein [Myxococcota bacterium]